MENEFLIFILVLVAVSLCMLGLYFSAQYYRKRKDFGKRLEEIERITPDEEFEKKTDDSGKRRFFDFIGSLGKALEPKKEENISELRRMFFKAGYRKESARTLFFGLKILLALSLFGVVYTGKLFFWREIPPGNFIYILFFFTLTGFYLPNLWIKLRIAKRKEGIQHGLPDALDLMVVCVEAGVGLDAAINKVAEEIRKAHGVLAEELRLVNLEIRAGKQRQEALKNLVWRTDSDDLSSLITLLIQTERFGTSIAQALRVHSDAMRIMRYQRAEEMAQKLPIKLIFPVALFILPMFFIVSLGPAMFTIMKHFSK